MNLKPNNKYIRMYIAGEEVVCNSKISIVEELTNTNTTVLENCYPLSWEQTKDYTQFYMPKDYSLFKMIYDYTNYDLLAEDGQELLTENSQVISVGNSTKTIFIGVIKRNKAIDLNPNKPHFGTFQVLDMKTFLNEGDIFNFVITQTTVINFINRVIEEYSRYNFVVGNINLNGRESQTVGNYSCDQKTLFDVLQYISQITNSIWKVRYIDDTTFAIDFFAIELLEQGKNLIYDTQFANDNSIIEISYNFNSSNYRNKQVMTSENIISHTLNTEEFYAENSDNVYTLDNNIGQILKATIDGINISIATSQDKDNGITADLYYTVGSNQIELDIETIPTQRVNIDYYPMLPGRITVLNTDEIERISNQLNNTGIIARYENRRDAITADELNAIGQTYIQFKGNADVNLVIKTINNDLWDIGQVVYFDNNGQTAIEDLVGNYAVKKKTTQIIQNNADSTNNIFYTYELNNNFNFENAINFFDNQRAKLIGNIEEGQFINRYIENTEEINIIFDEPIVLGGD